jgi:long-subunit acyl-CoA synthetase (AMP-forming)
MTETSPVSFMTSVDDGLQEKLYTVGRVFPHTSVKVIGPDGSIVPRGVRGELCVSGYCLHKGYLNDPVRTAEALIADKDGIMWMRSGDEATLDEKGYCRITGRIKDIIIRGESLGTFLGMRKFCC